MFIERCVDACVRQMGDCILFGGPQVARFLNRISSPEPLTATNTINQISNCAFVREKKKYLELVHFFKLAWLVRSSNLLKERRLSTRHD